MAKQTSAIQYSIMDIYVVLALVMTGLLLAPIFMHGSTNHAVKTIAIIIVTVFACLIALWRAHAGNLSGVERVICLAWYVLLGWGVGLVLYSDGWIRPCAICLVSLPGVIVGLRRARTMNYSCCERNTCVVFTTIGSWFLIWLLGQLLIPNLGGRRGGGTESAAVFACKAYAAAQDIYRRTDWDHDGVLEYSTAITGAYSLFEQSDGEGDIALVDAACAKAGMTNSPKLSPKAGYLFKILYGNGPASPGGRASYFDKNGDMISGYALIAWPVSYGETGTNSYIINNTGTVYQKNLGAGTANIIALMTEYNPDSSWVVAE